MRTRGGEGMGDGGEGMVRNGSEVRESGECWRGEDG